MHTPLSSAPGTPWVDGKRYLWLLSPTVTLIAGIGLLAFWRYDQNWLLWLGFIVLYGVIPALDWLVGEDRTNPPAEALEGLVKDRYYSWILYAFVPLQLGTLVLGGWLAVTRDLPWYHFIGLALTAGIINGLGINTAHELGHKKSTFDRWLARVALAPTWYGHFFVEHNRGHHKNVATPVDQSWAMSVLLFGAMVAVLGWAVLPYLVIQAVYGFSLLEVVNYLEHYGLLRQKGPDGRFVRCDPEHSWNSNHVVTNLFLYQLQRHSDHHANPTRHYQALRHFDDAPQLPSGYAGMIVLAYVPPLWFAVMNKRVVRHYKGDMSLVNMQPSKRAALMARYAG